MRTRVTRFRSIVLACLVIAGCGQKGPLYLPDAPKPSEPAPAPATAPGPTR